MARGFGATRGAGTTDAIVANVNLSPLDTVAGFAFTSKNGGGGGGFGRIFDIQGGACALYLDNTNNRWTFQYAWSGGTALWYCTHPGTGWTSVGFSYDPSSTANDPVIYVDGVAASVTEQTAPSGTANSGATLALRVGNRSGSDRVWDGDIARAAWWRGGSPSSGEFASMHGGADPSTIQASTLIYYNSLSTTTTPEVGSNVSVTGTALQDDPTFSSPATAVTLTGPTSGTSGVASTDFTVGADGTITGDVVVTPSDGGDGGTFTPTTVTINSGSPTGTFTYTPASTGTKTISVTNDGGLTNPSSISYTSNAPSDTTNPSAPGTPAFSAVTKSGCTVTYAAATDDTAVTGYERRFDGGSVVDVGNVLTFDISGQTPGDTVTVEVRAYDAAGNRGAWASADVTFLIFGIDLDDPALDLEVGNVSGSLVDLGMLASTSVRVTIQDPDTSAVVHEATVATSAAGVLPRVQHASLDAEAYLVVLQTTEVDPMDRSVASIIIEATAP